MRRCTCRLPLPALGRFPAVAPIPSGRPAARLLRHRGRDSGGAHRQIRGRRSAAGVAHASRCRAIPAGKGGRAGGCPRLLAAAARPHVGPGDAPSPGAPAPPPNPSRNRAGGARIGGRGPPRWTGSPSCPHAAIWSSPRESRTVQTRPPWMRMLLNRAICSSVEAANMVPTCGLNMSRFIFASMPSRSSSRRRASSSVSLMPLSMRYSMRTCRRVEPAPSWLGKSDLSDAISSWIGYRRFTGTIQSRTSSVVACRETASCALLSRQKRSISGTRPTVETEILLCDMWSPIGWQKMLVAARTASRLCRGSPMPMNTTLVIGVLSPTEARYRRASTSCSTICAVRRFPPSPIRPVRQNWQFMAHPSWLETQSVMRSFRPELRRIGMSTASTFPPAAGPSLTRNTSLRVPSDAS
mmetsp:Transcript_917/g.2191  ORF Transcript_917/g.2191 Transcript_917/m.2191 type:complete len:411 (+) Transcript_917:40-1272(+)